MSDSLGNVRRGLEAFYTGSISDAITFFTKALDETEQMTKEQQAEVHLHLGRCYFNRLMVDSCISHFSMAISLDSELEGARHWLDAAQNLQILIRDQMRHYLSSSGSQFDDTERLVELRSRLDNSQIQDEAPTLNKSYEPTNPLYDTNPRNPMTWYYLAFAHYVRQEMDEAIKAYQQAIELDPELVVAYHGLMLSFAKQGKLQRVYETYRKATAINPDSDQIHECLWTIGRTVKDYNMAIKAFKETISAAPDVTIVYCYLGMAHQLTGEFTEAIQTYEKAINVQPELIPAYLGLMLSFASHGEIQSVYETYKKATAVDPEIAEFHDCIYMISQQKGEIDAAIRAYEEVIETSPNNAAVYHYMGMAYYAKGDFAQAIQNFEKAARINPGNSGTYRNLGIVYTLASMIEQAIESFKKAIDIDPNDFVALNNLGLIYHEQNKYLEAIDIYSRAAEVNPNNPDIFNSLGMLYLGVNDEPQAMEAFQTALKLNPEHAYANGNLAVIYHRNDNLDRAIELYEKSLEIEPRNAAVHSNIGLIFQDKGDLGKAIESFQKSLEIEPGLPTTYNNLGAAYQLSGDLDAAKEAYQVVIDAYPKVDIQADNASAYNNLGLIHESRENYEEALCCWRRSMRFDMEFFYNPIMNSALCLSKQGKVNEALDILNSYIKLRPASAVLKLTLGKIYYMQSTLVSASPEERHKFLSKAIDVLDQSIEHTDSTSLLWRIMTLWIRSHLRLNGLNSTVNHVAQQLDTKFSKRRSILVFISLVALVTHFVEVLRGECLHDLKQAEEQSTNCIRAIDGDLPQGTQSCIDAANQIKLLYRKYESLDSNTTFLSHGEYKGLRDSFKKDTHTQLGRFSNHISDLVTHWITMIANQSFYIASTEPEPLATLYEETIETLDQQVNEIKLPSEQLVKFMFGCALEATYQACMFKDKNGIVERGMLSPLRHKLSTSYFVVLSELEALLRTPDADNNSSILRESIAENVTSIHKSIETQLEAVTNPIEFDLEDVLKNLVKSMGVYSGIEVESKNIGGKAFPSVYGLLPVVVTIFANLLDNAKHELQRYYENPDDWELEVSIRDNKEDSVKVVIRDNGGGISQDVIEAVKGGKDFVPSEKGGPVHGSGLVIVEDLTRSIRGRFDIRPRPDGGTIAEVDIPRRFGTGYELIRWEIPRLINRTPDESL